ncbi:hypothetical protein [Klebsiella phage vB_KpnM_VAC13]|nr:hypothetical protein [Klebsiella phage vB_KpnM_VAC13]QYC51262.1 hypothetical protein [Klebsiella phage vB_KpnM-VAC66]
MCGYCESRFIRNLIKSPCVLVRAFVLYTHTK